MSLVAGRLTKENHPVPELLHMNMHIGEQNCKSFQHVIVMPEDAGKIHVIMIFLES